jgi:C-terminal processing protease CtpA/Prc
MERYHASEKDTVPYKKIEEGIHYLNLDKMPMDEINKLMPELEKAKAIICDLRGYPKGNHDLINHLLKEKEELKWMFVPQIIYPDYEKVSYRKIGWNMEPVEPALTAKVVFITNGRAISYAESFMGYIEGFQLATIVGQPTAGTNGNVNAFTLPGGYRVTWTGIRVLKHDGSRFHGVGIIPHVLVERTIKGVKAGRDEFLDKAIEIAKQ